MKNRQSFLTAFLMSMIMIVSYNVFLSLTDNLAGTIGQDKAGLRLLQAVIMIKFLSASVVVMPSTVNIRQLVAGYIAADLLFCVPPFWNKSLFSFSAEMVIAQVVLWVICVASQPRGSASRQLAIEWRMPENLIFQGI